MFCILLGNKLAVKKSDIESSVQYRGSVNQLSTYYKKQAKNQRWVKQIKITVGFISKIRAIFTSLKMQREKSWKRKNKLPESEKYNEFKKKEIACVKEYRLKK